MFECPLDSRVLSELNPVALDDTIDIKLVCPGVMVGMFKVQSNHFSSKLSEVHLWPVYGRYFAKQENELYNITCMK